MFHVLIPARFGSKGLKNKNILKLNKKELIFYTIKTALSLNKVSRVVVSTNSDKISRIAKKYGAEVPFIRPKIYAQDNSKDLDVFLHYLFWLKKNLQEIPEYIIHLRPTCPFREVRICNKAISLIQKNKKISSLRSMRKSIFSPYKMWKIKKKKAVPVISKNNGKHSTGRQSLPQTYDHIAYIDIIKTELTLKKKCITGNNVKPFFLKETDLKYFVDIDNINDWKLAKKIAIANTNKQK